MAAVTPRRRLLEWIRGGDPDKMPLLFWMGADLPNVWFGHEDTYGYERQTQAARELGAAVWFIVHGPGIAGGAEYTEALDLTQEEQALPDGGVRTVRRYQTPGGALTAVHEKPPDAPLRMVQDFVSGPADVPAYAELIRHSATALLDNRERVIRKVAAETRANIAATRDEGPVTMWIFMPMVELTCSLFFRQEEGVLFILEQRELLEELMDLHLEVTRMWIAAGIAAGVDVFAYSINGYEIYSPDLFRRYIVPQARQIHGAIRAGGCLSWWHCCGRFREIISQGIWDQLRPDVMESYSPPPPGDITDLRCARQATAVRASRGAMPVGDLWQCEPAEIKRETAEIIRALRGTRHMLGGTDEMLPGTPRRNLIAMRDAVQEAGLAF